MTDRETIKKAFENYLRELYPRIQSIGLANHWIRLEKELKRLEMLEQNNDR